MRQRDHLSQVLLISFYLPRAILSRVRYVVETYPPSKYPKLYPVPIEAVEKAQRNYRNLNLFALLAGFVLLFIGVYSPTEEMLNWDSISVLGLYFLLQHSPVMIAASSGFIYFNFMRRADSRTTRKAELHPRRLFDFVSPVTIGIAIFVYVAFVGFIIYVRQFEFSWFGGYWNIFGITAVNLFFAGIIVQHLYGKKKDPYQAYEDRITYIRTQCENIGFHEHHGPPVRSNSYRPSCLGSARSHSYLNQLVFSARGYNCLPRIPNRQHTF